MHLRWGIHKHLDEVLAADDLHGHMVDYGIMIGDWRKMSKED